jgi:hypothetical protein
MPSRLAAFLAFAILLSGGVAWANPKALPFTYGAQTNPKGQGEVETYIDLIPLKARDTETGETVKYLAPQFQMEFEWGLSDRVELGLYLTFAPRLGDTFSSYPNTTVGNGTKQRIRWRLAEEGDWPIDVALYGEVSENEREIELEGKVILQKRFGNLLLLSNLWVEHEFYFKGKREWVFNPTLGFQYQATPNIFPGVEAWMRAELEPGAEEAEADFDAGPHVYVGPTLMVNLGTFFLTTGYYLRTTQFGRPLALGDAMGASWYRLIVGFNM